MRRSDWTCRYRCVACCLLALVAGCGKSDTTAEEREKVRSVVEQGLNAWQSGKPVQPWIQKNASLLFDDYEWKKGSKLLEYRVVEIRRNPAGHLEAIVSLKLQPAKGKVVEKKALYGVNFKSAKQVAVGRDPMF